MPHAFIEQFLPSKFWTEFDFPCFRSTLTTFSHQRQPEIQIWVTEATEIN